MNAFHALCCEESLSEVKLFLLDLERFDEGVLEQTGALKAIRGLRHEYTSDVDHVTRSAFASNFTTSNDFQHAGHVTYRYLVARLLNFYVLVGDESRRFDLENQLTIDFVCLALF